MSSTKFGMKDDQDFNIWFVKEIEKASCLYNHADQNYSNRHKQDEAWQKIATSANASVVDCRERWKNLRACFTRHLKHKLLEMKSGFKYKKPYYLAEHMHFILPFTKLRSQCQEDMKYYDEVIKQNDTPEAPIYWKTDNADDEEDENNSANARFEMQFANAVYDNSDLGEPTRDDVSVNNDVTDYSTHRKPAFESFKRKYPYEEDDPDLNFLKSLLPDMKSMTDSQKRKFKINILKLSDDILNT